MTIEIFIYNILLIRNRKLINRLIGSRKLVNRKKRLIFSFSGIFNFFLFWRAFRILYVYAEFLEFLIWNFNLQFQNFLNFETGLCAWDISLRNAFACDLLVEWNTCVRTWCEAETRDRAPGYSYMMAMESSYLYCHSKVCSILPRFGMPYTVE